MQVPSQLVVFGRLLSRFPHTRRLQLIDRQIRGGELLLRLFLIFQQRRFQPFYFRLALLGGVFEGCDGGVKLFGFLGMVVLEPADVDLALFECIERILKLPRLDRLVSGTADLIVFSGSHP